MGCLDLEAAGLFLGAAAEGKFKTLVSLLLLSSTIKFGISVSNVESVPSIEKTASANIASLKKESAIKENRRKRGENVTRSYGGILVCKTELKNDGSLQSKQPNTP